MNKTTVKNEIQKVSRSKKKFILKETKTYQMKSSRPEDSDDIK